MAAFRAGYVYISNQALELSVAAFQLHTVAAEKMIAQLVTKKDALMHIAASSQAPKDVLRGRMDF